MTEETIQVPAQTPAEAAPVVSAKPRGPDGRFASVEAEDAALDRIFAKAKGDPDPTPAPKAQPSPKAEAEEVPEKAQKPSADISRALKALELDGFTKDDLEGMPEQRILSLGQKAQKRQSDIGKKLSERAKTDDPATAAQETPKPASGQVDFKALAKSVGDLLGDDVGDALAKILEQSFSPITTRLSTAEAELQARAMERLEGEADKAREKLRERFPDLKDEENWDRVQTRMGLLAKTQSYETIPDLMRDACILEFPDASPSKPRNDTSRNNGQPTPVVRQKTPPAARTKEEAEDLALDEIFSKHRLTG